MVARDLPRGEIPDAAGMIGAVEGVTGRRVDPVVGKPSPITLRVALDQLRLPAADCAVVGDRLETDVAMGRAAGVLNVVRTMQSVTAAERTPSAGPSSGPTTRP